MTKQIQEAYIVATTRTPVGKAPRGMMRNVRPDDMLAHVIKGALAQVPGLDVNLINDVVVGCAFPEAEQGLNMARIGVLLAGLPDTVGGITINRYCSSGINAVQIAEYLIKKGAEINGKTETGATALYLAARNGHRDVVKLLLHHQADPAIANQNGETAVDAAMKGNHSDILDLLRAAGGRSGQSMTLDVSK